ncbi:MAG: MipA/OmpV family protein [Gammaproteobacteria bacterium]|nr:MipA/OmpV family protein [Gammaproteobacteria bacterium]
MKISNIKLLKSFISSLFILSSTAVLGEDTDLSKDDFDLDTVTVGEFNFELLMGWMQLESPVLGKGDMKLNLIPRFSYYGEKFYIENTKIGYSLAEEERWNFDLIGKLNQDGVYFNENSSLNGLADVNFSLTTESQDIGRLQAAGGADIRISPLERDFSYMAGISGSFHFSSSVSTYFSYTSDVSGVHNGYETDLAISYRNRFDDINLIMEIGVVSKSDQLTDYYYGVQDNIPGLSFYEVTGSTQNPYFSVSINKRINKNWSLVYSNRITYFDDKITESPIVLQDRVNYQFLGLSYRFD